MIPIGEGQLGLTIQEVFDFSFASNVPVVPLPLARVVGVFERLSGSPAWRHFERFAGGTYEGRAEVERVERCHARNSA